MTSLRLRFLSFFVVACCAVTLAEDKARAEDNPSHPVVLRIPKAAFSDAINSRVETTWPVKQLMLGTPVEGEGRTIGDVEVDLEPSAEGGVFLVRFQGTCECKTIGTSGPARIYSRGNTDFSIERRIVFSPRDGFRCQPTEIKSTTRLTLEDVQADRQGWRGGVVRRIAWRRARESLPDAEEIARSDTREAVRDAFDQHVDLLVVGFNQRYAAYRYVENLVGNITDIGVNVSSSDDSVQLAMGPALPDVKPLPASSSEAAMELWIHRTAVDERIWETLHRGLSLRWMPIVLRVISPRLEIQHRGDWLLINLPGERALPAGPPQALAQ